MSPKTLLKRIETETSRLQKKGEDLSFMAEALEFVENDEGTKGIAIFIAHQPEIMVFEKLRNLVADLAEVVLAPPEEDKGKRFNDIPVILEYRGEDGAIYETDNFGVDIDVKRKGGGVLLKETVFSVGKDRIDENRSLKKDQHVEF